MTPHDLILEYVDAARAVERWTARAEQLKCPSQHLHTKNNRLLPAGATCKQCRDRINTTHKRADARKRRAAALSDMHKYVLATELREHKERKPVRRRVRKEQLA